MTPFIFQERKKNWNFGVKYPSEGKGKMVLSLQMDTRINFDTLFLKIILFN